jgi:hypothetical protein
MIEGRAAVPGINITRRYPKTKAPGSADGFISVVVTS